ncbi:MAG TPA: hypothetical protein ENJ09_11750 [Planctomycetes bacterium]|nr:hypothetical protein [Planctomycetota bacterium]
MDFLLECIGFPPSADPAALAELVMREGEPVPYRGPSGCHRLLRVAPGVEIRLDQEEGATHQTLWPHHEATGRLRVAVTSLHPLAESPSDAVLFGIANPPVPAEADDPSAEELGIDYAITTFLSDARRVPRSLPQRHVLAISVSGFAVDVSYLGPNEGVRDPFILEEPRGASLCPVADETNPRGCMELSLRIRKVRRLENHRTRQGFLILETDAPGRPIDLFLSLWQIQADGFEAPRPGWRIEGAFLFTGRVAGGLPRRRRV